MRKTTTDDKSGDDAEATWTGATSIVLSGVDSTDVVDRAIALSRLLEGDVSVFVPPGHDLNLSEQSALNGLDIRVLNKEMAFERLVATSLEALAVILKLEIACEKLVLWATPEIDMATGSELRSSAIAGLSAARLMPLAPDDDAARAWEDLLGVDAIPMLNPQAFAEDETSPAEGLVPLIDKTDKPRILIDAGGHATNLALVNPLLELRGRNCEVWVLFDGVLKSWMQPDFQIPLVPADEIDLHFASVDMIDCRGVDRLAPLRLRRALALGVVPVALDNVVMSCLSDVGAETLQPAALDAALPSRSALPQYAEAARKTWERLHDTDGDLAKAALASCSMGPGPQDALRRAMSHAVNSYDALPLDMMDFFDAENTNEPVAEPQQQNLVELPVSEGTVVRLLGWAVAAKGAEETEIILSPSESVLVLGTQTRNSRDDVLDALNLPAGKEPGFEAHFLLTSDLAHASENDMLVIAISASSGYAAPLPRSNRGLSEAECARASKQIARIKSNDGGDMAAVFSGESRETSVAAQPETVIGFVDEITFTPGLVVTLDETAEREAPFRFRLKGWVPVETPLPTISARLELPSGGDLIETKVRRYGTNDLYIDLSFLPSDTPRADLRVFLPIDQFKKQDG